MDETQLKTFIAAMQKSHQESTQKLINEMKTQFQAQPQPSVSGTSDQITRFEKFNSKVEVFTSYIERFKNHLKLINLKDTDKQASLLCESIGAEHYNQLAAFLGPEKQIDTLPFEDLISKFTSLLQSKKSPVLAQHQFFQCYQSENQSIAEYVAQLQKALIECDFHVVKLDNNREIKRHIDQLRKTNVKKVVFEDTIPIVGRATHRQPEQTSDTAAENPATTQIQPESATPVVVPRQSTRQRRPNVHSDYVYY